MTPGCIMAVVAQPEELTGYEYRRTGIAHHDPI